MIESTLKLIKEQTGLDLPLCNYFARIRQFNGQEYFNIMLSQRTCESQDFENLKTFAEKYKLIKVEPNGLRRVAVFFNDR